MVFGFSLLRYRPVGQTRRASEQGAWNLAWLSESSERVTRNCSAARTAAGLCADVHRVVDPQSRMA